MLRAVQWSGSCASYTEGLAEAGIEPSVGSRGDSYDNPLAESIIGLFKTEVIRRCGPWRSVEDVAFATLEWVWWFSTTAVSSGPSATSLLRNTRRLTTLAWRLKTSPQDSTPESPVNPGRFSARGRTILVLNK